MRREPGADKNNLSENNVVAHSIILFSESHAAISGLVGILKGYGDHTGPCHENESFCSERELIRAVPARLQSDPQFHLKLTELHR